MRILVIGATGYVGRYAAAALAAAGHQVSAARRPGGRPAPDGYPPVPADLTDPASLTTAAAGFDLVVHAGAPLGPELDLAGAEALLAAATPVLYTTGAAVLGAGQQDERSAPDPHPIAAGRPELERRVLSAGGRVIRPGLVYGHGDGLVHGLLTDLAAARGTGIYIGPPGTRLPVVHVDDLADLYALVVARAAPGTVWHGTAETVRLDAIATALGAGTAVSWPLAEATPTLGLLADLFTRDQDVSSTLTRTTLGWHPHHRTVLTELTPVTPRPGRLT